MAKKAKKAKKKKLKSKPSELGKDGRNSKGQFAKENILSVGNKGGGISSHSKELRKAFIEAFTLNDIKKIAKSLKKKAKAGDVASIKEVFDRLWGRAKQEHEIIGAVVTSENLPVEEMLKILRDLKDAGNGLPTN